MLELYIDKIPDHVRIVIENRFNYVIKKILFVYYSWIWR